MAVLAAEGVVMGKTDEQLGKRHIIRSDGQNFYLYVSNTDIMFSGPGENDILHQERFSSINLICRLVSKARKNNVKWRDILKQFDSVNLHGSRNFIVDIAQAIRDTGVVEE